MHPTNESLQVRRTQSVSQSAINKYKANASRVFGLQCVLSLSLLSFLYPPANWLINFISSSVSDCNISDLLIPSSNCMQALKSRSICVLRLANLGKFHFCALDTRPNDFETKKKIIIEKLNILSRTK